MCELANHPERSGLLVTMIYYLLKAGSTGPSSSTFTEFLEKVEDATVKDTIMTIAEQLKQEGRQEGREEGRRDGIVRQVQQCQRLLNLPITDPKSLEDKPQPELLALLEKLETTLKARLEGR